MKWNLKIKITKKKEKKKSFFEMLLTIFEIGESS